MKQIHRARARGVTENSWLNSQHSFSFADYFNPDRLGFGKLRVLNDDTVLPNNGFSLHSHTNMNLADEHLQERDAIALTHATAINIMAIKTSKLLCIET